MVFSSCLPVFLFKSGHYRWGTPAVNVDDVIAKLDGIAKVVIEVLHHGDRMKDLPDFAERGGIVKDLTKRATQQQGCLDERDQGQTMRAKLVSTGVKLVLDASHALAG